MPFRTKNKRANDGSSVMVPVSSRPRAVEPRAATFDRHDPTGREDWRAGAACRGMGSDLLFPTSGDAITHATRICERCPVVEECRTTALDDPSLYGTWVDTPAGVRLRLRSDEGLGW